MKRLRHLSIIVMSMIMLSTMGVQAQTITCQQVYYPTGEGYILYLPPGSSYNPDIANTNLSDASYLMASLVWTWSAHQVWDVS